MALLKKLYSQTNSPGLEWVLLKKMPKLAIASTVIPLLMSLFARLVLDDANSATLQKQLSSIDIVSIAISVTAWTALFTITIGCVVVVIMKGPQYKADSYELSDSDQPARHNNSD